MSELMEGLKLNSRPSWTALPMSVHNQVTERLERVQKAIGASEEKKWSHRMRVLVNHFSVHMEKKKNGDGETG